MCFSDVVFYYPQGGGKDEEKEVKAGGSLANKSEWGFYRLCSRSGYKSECGDKRSE